jgi:hypothetical protein
MIDRYVDSADGTSLTVGTNGTLFIAPSNPNESSSWTRTTRTKKESFELVQSGKHRVKLGRIS